MLHCDFIFPILHMDRQTGFRVCLSGEIRFAQRKAGAVMGPGLHLIAAVGHSFHIQLHSPCFVYQTDVKGKIRRCQQNIGIFIAIGIHHLLIDAVDMQVFGNAVIERHTQIGLAYDTHIEFLFVVHGICIRQRFNVHKLTGLLIGCILPQGDQVPMAVIIVIPLPVIEFIQNPVRQDRPVGCLHLEIQPDHMGIAIGCRQGHGGAAAGIALGLEASTQLIYHFDLTFADRFPDAQILFLYIVPVIQQVPVQNIPEPVACVEKLLCCHNGQCQRGNQRCRNQHTESRASGFSVFFPDLIHRQFPDPF